MRRRLLLVALAVPLAVPAIVHGCSNEQPFESVCDWLNDPNNCYRDFHQDMLAAAGPDNPNGDCRTWGTNTAAAAIPTQASEAKPGVSNGSFLMRAMLDTCILDEGGSVVFNPPIDLTMFPPSIFADPITYAISIKNADGNECGNMTYTSPHGFAITIDPPPDAGTTAMGTGGGTTTTGTGTGTGGGGLGADAGPASGSYTQVIAPGRDAFDVTCPTGEAHHFNLDEVLGVSGLSTSQCPGLSQVLPAASLQIFLGGVDTPGALSFAITWPPAGFAPGVPYIPDGGNFLDAGTVADTPVVYFNCAIPAAAETCADGIKNDMETDIDCGGPQIPSMQQCGSCPARCEVGQQCICDADCDGLGCTTHRMSGQRQCENPDGGHDFTSCAWSTTAPLPCTPSATTGAGGGSTTTGTGGAGTGGAGTGGAEPADAGDGG